jgi:hypothetical protein
MALSAVGGLLTAAAVHLGFQAVVTIVVYPALAEVPPERWDAAHAAHTRRITAVVAPVYALLGGAAARALLARPGSPLVLVAAGGAATAALSTALVAAPAHRRLARDGRDAEALATLRRSDRARLLGACVAAGAALAAARADV